MTSPLSSAVTHARRRPAGAAILLAAVAILLVSLNPAQSVAQSRTAKPTVVLVHGAWADASSWSGVVTRLQDDGYKVIAAANPLRSLSGDAAYVKALLETLAGPIVLVGHSYGGAVITNAATGNPNIKALVYVNAFAPDAGETPTELAGPDSALSADPTTVFDFVPATLPPTAATDLYLKRSTVFASFATGLSADDKALVAATQRPATIGALNEPSGTPAWRTIPSWNLIGTEDRIIPASVQRTMAKRAGSTTTEYDEGHVGLMTDPGTVTRVIERAARH
ncbi:pimeloyl-ACP methyl ester carboxylesterase [Kribbella sp. VKM Ac-2527]|uniref:Pimeloyl-ACP methyl ester carboxylesterase n=1 Tax=Kribbella caucasensis TaxID=2512215 RepID=A0A4R6KDI7_9ACTN|nr:alpha/beta hydrolase [Kribbella sp. VKM Ac-2527]TDO46637.1 pimeloyl-ACP methyl ester carboxylesterase [Kribbella sp. VKM Ac-2527]